MTEAQRRFQELTQASNQPTETPLINSSSEEPAEEVIAKDVYDAIEDVAEEVVAKDVYEDIEELEEILEEVPDLPEIEDFEEDDDLIDIGEPPLELDLAPEMPDEPEDLVIYEPQVSVKTEDIPAPTDATVVPPVVIPQAQKPAEVDTEDNTMLKTQIKEFKEKTVDTCLHFINHDVGGAEIKEFKDIVAIMDTVEKSIEPKKNEMPQVAIQVVVQNLMAGVTDDC